MKTEEAYELTPKGWQVLAEADRRELGLGRKMTDEEQAAFLKGWEIAMAILDGHYDE
jgi:hypothetical protein